MFYRFIRTQMLTLHSIGALASTLRLRACLHSPVHVQLKINYHSASWGWNLSSVCCVACCRHKIGLGIVFAFFFFFLQGTHRVILSCSGWPSCWGLVGWAKTDRFSFLERRKFWNLDQHCGRLLGRRSWASFLLLLLCCCCCCCCVVVVVVVVVLFTWISVPVHESISSLATCSC